MIRLSILSAVFAGTVMISPVSAHELKVMASKLVANPGDDDTVYLSFGHVLPIDAPVDAEALSEYRLRTPSGSTTFLASEGTSLQSNVVHVEESGIYQAAAARKPAVLCVVATPSGGHKHVMGGRSSVTEGEVEQAFRSLQFAKALLVSGPENSAELPEPLGHELEIVPAGEPDSWRPGRDIPLTILFQGKPLSGADLVATYIGFKPDNAWCYATSTDGQGLATVRPDRAGTWVVRVRTQRPAPAEDRKEFDMESYVATLVFEVRP